MQRRLCRIIHGRKHIRHDGRQAADLDNGTLCLDEQRGESLAHAHDGEDVDLERELQLLVVNLERGHRVVAPGVVDEKVEPAAGAA